MIMLVYINIIYQNIFFDLNFFLLVLILKEPFIHFHGLLKPHGPEPVVLVLALGLGPPLCSRLSHL